jgi:hemoglobin-like flavoprotein
MGNTCPGDCSNSKVSDLNVEELMNNDTFSSGIRKNRSEKYSHISDTKSFEGSHGKNFISSYAGTAEFPMAQIIEHYQPYEFPMQPVINSRTQNLVKNSWKRIVETEYDSADTASGKISGASYFYNVFFEQLFKRLDDFSRIFPSIKSRADIFSKVMAFCISISIEELDYVKVKLNHLGKLHKNIVNHPHLFGIYATNIHSTIRICLGDDASHEIMAAWINLLSFILRNMLPSYFEGTKFTGHHEGAVNASSAITEKAKDEVKSVNDMKEFKKKMRSKIGSEATSITASARTHCDDTERTQVSGQLITPLMSPSKDNEYGQTDSPIIYSRGLSGISQATLPNTIMEDDE